MYMLDTNICIYVLKKHSDQLRRQFKAAQHLCISSVTYGELCFGIENGQASLRKPRQEQLALFTRNLPIVPWGEDAARHYGVIRAFLRRRGTPIGNNDLLIASHARSMDVVLVTNNVREFCRVPDLLVEDWVA